jgi:hypothetical protein
MSDANRNDLGGILRQKERVLIPRWKQIINI